MGLHTDETAAGRQMMLPWDVLEIIKANWPGRGLALTCKRLCSTSADNYVTAVSLHADGFTATLSTLPNGRYHGISILDGVRCRASSLYGVNYCETVEYNLGRIVEKRVVWPGRAMVVVDSLRNGYQYSWLTDDYTLTPSGAISINPLDTGVVQYWGGGISNIVAWNVRYCDVAQTISTDTRAPGSIRALYVSLEWQQVFNINLPDTD